MNALAEVEKPAGALVLAGRVLSPALFAQPDQIDALLHDLEKEVRSHALDISTKSGREFIKSLAYKVAKSKTALDDMGATAKADAQKLVTSVDKERRRIRERMDALRDEVRKPLDDWEAAAEQARQEAERKAEAERLAAADAARREIEERERAKREAEERAENERQARQEAEARHAREMREAAEKAVREQAAAVQAERQRREAKDAAEAEEARRREANKRHRAKINNEALDGIVQAAGVLPTDAGRAIVEAIARGAVPHVTISY